MKTALVSLWLGASLLLLFWPGCTPIETPVNETPEEGGRPGDVTTEPLRILPEKFQILDTQPIALEAQGGLGTIMWHSEPHYEQPFSPETGRSELFTPPDLDSSATITIIAVDEKNNSCRAEAVIADQGGPPGPGDILINEIAWAGTLTSPYDEYLELINKTARPFYLKEWAIENAAGAEMMLHFSGRIEGSSLFLIANYGEGSEKSAVTARVDLADPKLSLSNSTFGPFILHDGAGTVFDSIGDGGTYPCGLNSGGIKASMARFSSSRKTEWDRSSWYTEGLSVNLKDTTFGTPGAANSDTPYSTGPPGGNDGDARAIIAEFFVKAHDEIGEDWIELFITEGGNVKNFVVTDLDGTDSSISNGIDARFETGKSILVVWADAFGQSGNRFYIPDQRPPSTKDELVLLCGNEFLDGLCYSTDGKLPDDYETLRGYGWEGEPISSTYGARLCGEDGNYPRGYSSSLWRTDCAPTPGEKTRP